MPKLTPMMEQYFQVKNKYEDCLLFFRLGDFYELFYEDAITASRELEITLTGKNCGQEERAPMCGVPYHSADSYIARLIEKGYNVAICEQTEDPKEAKGIVKREVIRVVTPGTVLDTKMLDETKNNYIMCIYAVKTGFGLAVCDVSTGEFMTTEFISVNSVSKINDELFKYSPAEIICNKTFNHLDEFSDIEKNYGVKPRVCADWQFDLNTATDRLCRHFNVLNLDGYGLKLKNHAVCASGSLLEYLYETQKTTLSHISSIKCYEPSDYMLIDKTGAKNLELVENMHEKSRKGTLLWVLDRTKTAMGSRLIRKWIERPLTDIDAINHRLDAVNELKHELFIREEIKDVLSSMHDFERIMGRIAYKNANARDLCSLKNSIQNLPLLKEIIRKCKNPYFKEIYRELDSLENICSLIETSIKDDAPFTVHDGGMIKRGYDKDLDILLNAREEGGNWLASLEAQEKEKTDIKTLRIKYNKIFGYYIEVSKGSIKNVPDRYIRKQTLANCERYITKELNELAELILGSEEKIVNMEYTLFTQIRDAIASEIKRIQYAAYNVSVIDVIQSLGEVAEKQSYVRPIMNDKGSINIKDGRHPVVEKLSKDAFIPNDTVLDTGESRLLIITGPNMAGKSTYMRQTALIVLMAHIGSFVPASLAEICIVDRIFTRVGASDDLASGQSTFMVEMTEVANILNNATDKSLLILDEIGRGTSTFDGLSIAWSVLEYIADKKQIGAKTLFATHYHELTELEGRLSGVKNYCIAVKEQGDDIIFLRKIKRGGADNSYGIQVAQLAGLPSKVIRRSTEILKQLDAADINKKAKKLAIQSKENSETTAIQVDMFNIKETQLADEIGRMDIMAMTPMEALQKLFELQKKAKGL